MALDDWLRWEAGEKRTVLVQSAEPLKRLVHWTGEMYEECEGRDCAWCDRGVKRISRYAVEALAEDDVWTWEMAGLVWKQLKACAEEYGGLRGLKVVVKRTGEGRKTRYSIVPVGNVPMGEEVAALWDKGSIAKDPEGAAAFAKELAASLEITVREAMDKFLATDGQALVEAGGVDKLSGLIKWLDRQVKAQAAEGESEPEIDLDALLA